MAYKTIKCNLTSASITNLISKLNTLSNELEKSANNIVDDLLDIGKDEVLSQYNGDTFKEEIATYTVKKERSGNKGKVVASGNQILYDEYGTGFQGSLRPHPDKSKISGLKAYESGPKINKVTHKWVYLDSNKKPIVTTGRPAGMYMFYGFQKIQEKKLSISKKRVGEAISKI